MKTNVRAGIASLGLLLSLLIQPGKSADLLESGFLAPPPEARPWVYWFWLNGNISSNGITADLEAMQRVGIGGVLIMEVDQGAPVGPADFAGAQWRQLFKHVVAEAGRLGLEVNMNNDAGWNGSGGPWIKPEQSMQKVVWSETNLTGPLRFEGTLPQPETVAGFYRDITTVGFPDPGTNRIDRIKAKAAYEAEHVGEIDRKELPKERIIDRSRIVSLTSQIDREGHLVWDVPEGQWTVLRLGHTSTGVENAPAPKTGRGLECDKLSKEGIEANFAGLMSKLIEDNGVRPGRPSSLVATHIDSWENGAQNWTARMRDEFQKRRGYDLFPFLPVMTGRVVDSLEISERFLWDLRRTVSELVIQNYAGHTRELAHAHGLRFTVEAYGSPCDFIPYGGESDEPMGEFWSPSGAMETCRGMASSAHVYGKRIVGAESFTAGDGERWREYPATLKILGDQAFCEGINRFVFHRYALQPWKAERRPGMTMGPWGQHYERTQTWWDQTPDWHRYLARCQFLLRQGLFVADICYLQAEASPQGFADHPRRGYNWDECGAEVVLNRLAVRDGRLVLPDGMSYRLLALPQTTTMTPALLRKIRDLVRDGATVVGTPPQQSPSLTDYPLCDKEVRQLVSEIWGDCDGARITVHPLGSGKVVWGTDPEKVLHESGVPPDFTSAQPLRHIHRHLEDGDVYFVANPAPRALMTTATFRVKEKLPELWWPDTGRLEPAALYQAKENLTSLALSLDPGGSVFVVFRRPISKQDPVVRISREGKPLVSAVPEPPPRILIQNATYGIPNDARSRDVHALVQRRVDLGQSSFKVSVVAEGDDPAPGMQKTLRVQFEIDGKSYSVAAQDPQTIYLTPNALKIAVQKARYGVLDDPKRTRDVAQKLQRLVDAGESSFQVARMAEGDDPAFMVVKTLELEFMLDGRLVRMSAKDPDLIDMKPSLPETDERTLEFHAAADGRPRWTLFQPGRYVLETASGKRRELRIPSTPQTVEVTGPWRIDFAPNQGASWQQCFEKLGSWTAHSDPGVKYFSGSATYRKVIQVPRGMLGRSKRLFLDLGRVEVMAEVTFNGKKLAPLWKRPFRLDITDAAKPGDNQIEVRVTNLWPNRMIGDEQLPEDSERNKEGTLKVWPQWLTEDHPSPAGRLTFTSWRLWKASDPLLESGLLGPVTLVAAEER